MSGMVQQRPGGLFDSHSEQSTRSAFIFAQAFRLASKAASLWIAGLARTTNFLQGSLWMIGMRWAIRSVGLVSTVILARVLTPADFGIVAMASLVGGLLGVFLEMGTWQLLLRMGNPDRKAYDTAWTIAVIQSSLMAVIVFFAAYPAALYFKEPRLVSVMQILALGGVLTGFSNIGIVMFRRDLDFKRDFLYGFFSKVVATVPTIVLALSFRNYWALVAGMIIANAMEVVVSYAMHPFRPRFSLAYWRQFISFSIWITPTSVANFLNQKVDVFVVGYVANTAQMGAYNVAAELARTATAEIVIPMSRAVYPNYAKLKDNLNELTEAFLVVLRTVGIVSFSFGFGVAAVGEDIVHIVLGDQWAFAVPLMAWLSIFGAFAALQSTVAGHILIVLGRERSSFFIHWTRLIVFGSSVLVAAHFGDVVDIAMATALSTAAITIACACYLPAVLPVSAARILAEIFRVLIAGLVMFGTVKLLHRHDIPSHFVTLAIDAVTGTVVFVVLLYISWIASGRPRGPEQRVLGIVTTKLQAFASRA
jgi:lipopolysaccharide exporter